MTLGWNRWGTSGRSAARYSSELALLALSNGNVSRTVSCYSYRLKRVWAIWQEIRWFFGLDSSWRGVVLLYSINVLTFYLGGHDWGVMIADNIINLASKSVERHVRCCLSLHNYNPRNSLHHQWNGQNPEKGAVLMANAGSYVRVWFDTSCKLETRPSEVELKRVFKEFSYQGIAGACSLVFLWHKENQACWLFKICNANSLYSWRAWFSSADWLRYWYGEELPWPWGWVNFGLWTFCGFGTSYWS